MNEFIGINIEYRSNRSLNESATTLKNSIICRCLRHINTFIEYIYLYVINTVTRLKVGI